MDELIIEGVRCFRDRQEAPLRPITLLVGENSTGKTTFLALARMAWDICAGDPSVDFNEEPFLLGSYDEIASVQRGKSGRAPSFTIGARVPSPPDLIGGLAESLPDTVALTGRFVSSGEHPRIEQWSMEVGAFKVDVPYGEHDIPREGRITTPSGTFPIENQPEYMLGFLIPHTSNLKLLPLLLRGSGQEELVELCEGLPSAVGPRPYAFAPIRTRPKRTYDPVQETPEPSGGHIPMVLARVSASEPKVWEELRAALNAFGKASGLFQDVKVQRMGRNHAGPFQLRVKVSGPAFNLVDVGYGVSQVLPIIADALRGEEGRTFLLQQPEVHLHPKAQAELSSFLALLAKKQNKRFVIETHSDYIVDRIRMEVRDGKTIRPDDVALLYFERTKGNVKIHRLGLDEMGNIVDAPKGYGAFFLNETRRLLGG